MLMALTDWGTLTYLQIQQYLEGPIGMALYEWKDGKIGNVCVQGGERFSSCRVRDGFAIFAAPH